MTDLALPRLGLLVVGIQPQGKLEVRLRLVQIPCQRRRASGYRTRLQVEWRALAVSVR